MIIKLNVESAQDSITTIQDDPDGIKQYLCVLKLSFKLLIKTNP